MRTSDAAANAVSNLASHPLRSILTMLGMIFGVGAVIAMLSIGEGAERQALEMIERLGIHNILVRDLDLDQEELEEIRTKSLGVSPRDAVAIDDGVEGVGATSRRVEVDPYTVLSDGVITEATVHGVDANFADLTSLDTVIGRFLDPIDLRDHAQVAVIGEGVRRDLFGGDPPLDRYLKVNDVWFEVVGVLRGIGSGTMVQGVAVGSSDQEIYVPVTTALRKLDLDPLEAPLDEIVVQMAPETDLREAARRIGLLVDRLHGGADDYELVVPDALLEQSRRTQRLFTIVMGTIAGISLLVGGIGIMNIMLATVFERTREIGIRRAVGARRRDIQVLFLMESFTISLLGGLAGIVLGVVIAKVVAMSAGWPTVVTPLSVVLSSGVSVAVGLTSGLYPALRAAALDPIDALRYE
jgi:putative ABC transport system permease protein